jgi:hypothetical protein
VLADSIASGRFVVVPLSLFAAVALFVAAVGIAGVIAYAVAERTPEIGIRVALGAERADIVRLVVLPALASTLTGVALGVAGSTLPSKYSSAPASTPIDASSTSVAVPPHTEPASLTTVVTLPSVVIVPTHVSSVGVPSDPGEHAARIVRVSIAGKALIFMRCSRALDGVHAHRLHVHLVPPHAGQPIACGERGASSRSPRSSGQRAPRTSRSHCNKTARSSSSIV